LRFFSSRKANKAPGVSVPGAAPILRTDIHSHILPGIDDGAPDLADALAMLALLERLGYTRVITTPHVMADYYPNTPTVVRSSLDRLQEAADAAGLGLSLEAAAEYMLDDGFEQALEVGDMLCFGDRHLLFECPFSQPYPGMRELLFRLELNGYRPVMAHPERYPYWHRERQRLVELHESGVLFQVNILSFAGIYGPAQRRQAEWLASQGMVDLLGTDLHRPAYEAELSRTLAQPLLVDLASRVMNAGL